MTDPKPATECPKCASSEWFPGAACWDCGWEGSAAEAYALMAEARAAEKARADKWKSLAEEELGHCKNKDKTIAELRERLKAALA